MDRQKLTDLAGLVAELLGDDEPTDEELDFDSNAIELYDNLHNLKESLQACGFWPE